MYIAYLKENYYFSLMCTTIMLIIIFEVEVEVQKGALRFREILTTYMLVSSNSYFHPLLPYGHSPSWLLGFQNLHTRGSYNAYGLPWVFLFFCFSLSRLWLTYHALVFVCLIKSLSYMLYMKNVQRLSYWKVHFMCIKGLFNSWFKIYIYIGGI